MAAQIQDPGGTYVLTLKDHQPGLRADVAHRCTPAHRTDFQDYAYDCMQTVEQG